VTIIQIPNKELIAAIIADLAADATHGLIHSLANNLFYVFLIIWAYREIAEGANWFRRGLGVVVIICTIASLTFSRTTL
jgi:hypothetical protein